MTAERDSYDAVLVGGGHNGLVAASFLARAGLAVLVLEQRPRFGGLAGAETGLGGLTFATGAGDLRLLRRGLLEQLHLEKRGLEMVRPAVAAFVPATDDHQALTVWCDAERVAEQLPRAEAERWPAFLGAIEGWVAEFEPMLEWTPQAQDLAAVVRSPQLMRVLASSVGELLDGHDLDQRIKGVLGWWGLLGGASGPRAQGGGYALLYQLHGTRAERLASLQRPRGGMGSFADALAAAARAEGAELVAGAPVDRILSEDGAAAGVRLGGAASGREIRAGVVVSNADPRRTLLGLVGAGQLDPKVVRRVRAIRGRGCTVRLELVLARLPRFRGQTCHEELEGEIVLAPHLRALELAARAAKYGHDSELLSLSASLPSALDPALVKDGKHPMLVTAQWAPYRDDGSVERPHLVAKILGQLEAVAPGLGALIEERRLVTAADWQAEVGLTEGSIHHLDMSLDQTFVLRPFGGASRYATPVPGLYLCGAGCHPGGGVTGLPGANAARQVLAERALQV